MKDSLRDNCRINICDNSLIFTRKNNKRTSQQHMTFGHDVRSVLFSIHENELQRNIYARRHIEYATYLRLTPDNHN